MEDQSHQTQGIGERIKKLFSTTNPVEVVAPQPPSQSNPENLKVGETYEQWGTRICGVVSGSLTALPPYLQKVFNYLYNEQAQNIELQKAARANTQADIDRKNEEIKSANQKIDAANAEIERLNKNIEEYKTERHNIKNSKAKVNKAQRIKLILGLIILIPLTFYLFLFYSSTFYSAFFRDPSSMTTVMNSMFDNNALANAYAAGLTELGFVLSAPIIFLGLGFALHFFSVQEGKIKYLKMGAILLVTVMFDCILAYKIGDQLHTFGIIIGQHPIGEEYTVSMAFRDINTWAVIFCGFIVYILWGIVFDMCMSAYDGLDLNKTQLEHIRDNIANLENKISEEKNKIQTLSQEITKKKGDVNALMAKLGHTVYINYADIRKEMTNFFAGWIKMMQVLSLDKNSQNQATEIYNQEVTTLITNQENKTK